MEAKHTPGPWAEEVRISRKNPLRTLYEFVGANGIKPELVKFLLEAWVFYDAS